MIFHQIRCRFRIFPFCKNVLTNSVKLQETFTLHAKARIASASVMGSFTVINLINTCHIVNTSINPQHSTNRNITYWCNLTLDLKSFQSVFNTACLDTSLVVSSLTLFTQLTFSILPSRQLWCKQRSCKQRRIPATDVNHHHMSPSPSNVPLLFQQCKLNSLGGHSWLILVPCMHILKWCISDSEYTFVLSRSHQVQRAIHLPRTTDQMTKELSPRWW